MLVQHVLHAHKVLRLALRKQVQVRDLSRGEQHCRSVRAGSHASTTTDASGGLERAVGVLLWNRRSVSVRSRTRVHGNVATGLNNAVQSRAVNNQVLNNRECGCSPRLDGDRVTIVERTHVELAGGGDLRAVRNAVDYNATLATDALTAVRVECDRLFASLE